MKHVSCPNCGLKLFEGDIGSHVVLKCNKCSKVFESTVEEEMITVILKNKIRGSDEQKSAKDYQ